MVGSDTKLGRRVAKNWIPSRKRWLLKAGYLEDEMSHREFLGQGAPTQTDLNEPKLWLEFGLLIFSLRELKKYKILEGRRNEIENYMRGMNESKDEAVARCRRNFRLKGYELGMAWNYVDYYY